MAIGLNPAILNPVNWILLATNTNKLETLMDLAHLIPSYQPLPFPLPVWLMQTLLVLGFFLHALPMNVVLGGGFISTALFAIGRSDQSSYAYRAAKALAVSLPLFISFAITQGIVPLLFLQLIYGPAFYTSSIIMAVPWISLLLVIMISYYLSYIVVYRTLRGQEGEKSAAKASLLLLVMSIGFSFVAFLFSNNMTLMLHPEKWLAMYEHSAKGMNLNSSEVTLIPRYLHFFVSSFAVAGMTLGLFGLYMTRKDSKFSEWMMKIGSRIFLAATVIQIPVGLCFLKAIPVEFAGKFLGGDQIATAVFGLSMALTLLSICTSTIAAGSGNRKAFIATVITNALLILSMIVNRHQLRLFHLNPHVKPDLVAVSTQWDLLAVFLVSTVALIWYLVWLSALVLKSYQKPIAEYATNSSVATIGEVSHG